MSRAEAIRPRQRRGQTGRSPSIAARSRRTWRTRAQEADAHLRSPRRSGTPSHSRTARCWGNGVLRGGGGDRGRVRDHAGGSVAAPQGAARERLCAGPGGGAKTTLFGGCRGASGGGCVDWSVQELLGAEVGRAGDGDRARQTGAAWRANGQKDWEEGLAQIAHEKEECSSPSRLPKWSGTWLGWAAADCRRRADSGHA